MKDELVEVTQADWEITTEILSVLSPDQTDWASKIGPIVARHRLSSSPVEEAPADVADVLKMAEWNVRHYAGNVAEEWHLVVALITRLSADLAAANEIVRKEAHNNAVIGIENMSLKHNLAEARKVIEPFAKAAKHFTSNVHNGGFDQVRAAVNGEDFRRARQWRQEEGVTMAYRTLSEASQ